ncbi:hypothetical protein C2S51_029566 [Perilla frutescens var. frutescens]|nr:hypothetical protein C2S51_029566 [Perilla frutescens var. frutescens]
MVKVIEDEKEEENVVSSGGAHTTTTILFPKLKEIELFRLHKLESFCEWKCDVEMPLLWKVQIRRCSNMKTFTRGPLITPNFGIALIHGKYFTEDLNGALEQHSLAREKEIQKRLAAYRENQRKTTTGEETKSEIEEEQNL